MRTAVDVEHRLREIYGAPRAAAAGARAGAGAGRAALGGDLARDGGVLHVAAVGRDDRGGVHAIAIGARAPRSSTDLFLLSVARARADAIVATGKILRQEPTLTHELLGPGGAPRALAAWRREVVGKRDRPLSLVLTSGRGLDLRHPLFRPPGRALIVTGPEGAAALRERARAAGIGVVERACPGLRDALLLARHELGAETVDVEAGPSTSAELYTLPLAVDELMLSVYEEVALSDALRAGPFLPLAELERLFARRSDPHRSREESGAWTFHRFRHAEAPAAAATP